LEKVAEMKLSISSLPFGKQEFNYHVDGEFFNEIEASEVRSGSVDVALSVNHRQEGIYELDFVCNGVITIPCDRCLDDMSLDIENSGELKVKLGPDFADEGDIVVVPEDKGIVNVAWYIYEFIALAIPIKHVHAPGKCNKGMMEKLDEHSAEEGDEDSREADAGASDPRWDALNSILESDNE
jgi:uncharacterized metal-binding protein YceD (DUF177 family)